MASQGLDLALVVLLASHVLTGWRAGGSASVLAMVGAVGGGSLALWQAPRLVSAQFPHASDALRSVVLLGLVLLAATVGELLLGRLGAMLRSRARPGWLRRVDSAVGCLATGLVTCLVVTTLASAVQPVLPSSWAASMGRSRVLPVMDAVVPPAAHRWASRATRAMSDVGFPRVFSGIRDEPVIPVAPPDQRAARTAAVRRAAGSVVKVHATACGQGHAGSGWVVARQRVVTNAHVVAGASSPTVQVTGGRALPARVVAYDPRLDLAVLDVPGLTATPLRRSGPLERGQNAAVAGFPRDGGYVVRAARVRGTIVATGDDIYGRTGSKRQVYALATTVQPGNSGGPLLTDQGTVAGTVFAKSLKDPGTGYALTDDATESVLRRAGSFGDTVSTQACSRS